MPSRFLILCISLFPIINCGLTNADSLETKLAESVPSYHLEADNFAEGLIQVSRAFQVPMGIQWINTPKSTSRISLSWNQVTVRGIIEGIATTQNGYTVTAVNGIVHVFSADVPDNQNFLILRIPSFRVHQDVVQEAERQLRSLVMSRTVPLKEGRGGVAGSLLTNIGEPRLDVELRDAAVEDILDSLAAASRKKIWVVTFQDSSSVTQTGFRRTSILRSEQVIPDDQQPVWKMFSWDELAP
jgi:hypothetical protein